MAVEFIITPEAEQDIDAAYGWYENHRVGLGEEFLFRVDACIQFICRHPTLYPIVHENYRRAPIRRFPYAIYYEHVPDSVTIYCIFHTARDAQKWQRRLP